VVESKTNRRRSKRGENAGQGIGNYPRLKKVPFQGKKKKREGCSNAGSERGQRKEENCKGKKKKLRRKQKEERKPLL